MVLRLLQWLLRPVSSLLYALFVLVSPRRGAERPEPLTQRGNTNQRSHSQAVIEELQMVRAQLETKMEEKKKIENQLRDTENTVTALQEKVKQLQDMLKMDKGNPFIEARPSNKENVTPAQLSSTPPPPPPPPVLSTSPIDPLDALRNRKKSASNSTNLKKPAQSVDVKTRAMDEMMDRIKKGVILKPTQKPPQDTIKQPGPQRMPSRKMIGQNLEEEERLAPKAQATRSSNWLAESGNVPVLQRLKQNH